MHTDVFHAAALTAGLLLASTHANGQETFPVFLPADNSPVRELWAADGHTSIVRMRNMTVAGEAFVKRVDYLDGLGRPEETVLSAPGTAEGDIVTFRQTDAFGRPSREWLPIPASHTDGAFSAGSGCLAAAAAYYADEIPYSATSYEPSPLSRVTAETGPGAAWHASGKSRTRSYLTNNNQVDSLKCMRYTVSVQPYTGVTVRFDGLYALGAVSVACEADEDGHVTLSFTDRCGRLLLIRRRYNSSGVRISNDTYFIYDKRDRLCAVIPPAVPKALGQVSDQAMSDFAYLYQYDQRGRLSGRKLPGAGWTYMVYDDADRLVLSQDREMFAKGISIFHAYDILGRECVTGTTRRDVDTGTAETGIPGLALCRYTGTGSLGGYEVSGIPLDEPVLLTARYYDTHAFTAGNAELEYSAVPSYGELGGSQRGLATGIVEARLSSSGICAYDSTAVYHDMRGRAVQTRKTNARGGHDVTMLSLELDGTEAARRHVHTARGMQPVGEVTAYTRDAWGRRVMTAHAVDGHTAVTLSTLAYDGVGRMAAKTTGGQETSAYTYNVRSWLTAAAGQRLTERLCYNEAVEGLSPALTHRYRWNGTVAACGWTAGGETRQRGYSLLYDGLDRLTEAYYGEGWNLTAYHTKYDGKAAYDCMGNPVWIYRKSPVSVDSVRPSSPSDRLCLEYDGNRLTHVTDSVTSGHNYEGAFHFADGTDTETEYEYDENGNMVKDLNRNISQIQYNWLNLPSMIQFGDNTYIYNTHSATGEKLTTQFAIQAQPILSPLSGNGGALETESAAEPESAVESLASGPATHIDTYHRYYCGNMVYDGGERRLLTDEGYVTFAADGTPQYHFYLRDHLGNIRVVFDQTGAVEQVTHYYPFGGVMRESTNPGLQPYKYGGKELDRTSGLDAYDFGARMYFADRLQWGQMDPLCEKYYDWSPYNYCGNGPINTSDLDGMDWYQDSDKTIQYSPNVHSQSDLKKNQLYIGLKYQNKQGTIFYRKDGSILFLHETEAYNRIWHQANVHYRNNGEKGGREVGGYILSDGKVLVMPDYLNDNSTSKFNIAGYKLKGHSLIKGEESFIVIGQVHSHQDKSLPATPSFFTEKGYGDLGFSLENTSLPVFTIGHDGIIHGIRGYRDRTNKPVGLVVSLNSKDASRENLLKGVTSLYSIIKRLPIIRK